MKIFGLLQEGFISYSHTCKLEFRMHNLLENLFTVNVFYCTALAKVNITFGEYQGVYENIDEVDIKNVFLKNSAAGHRRPEFRRFSHLKLMMSVMLGSGALASKFTEYGCHCLLGPDVVPAPSRVPAVDNIDETCRRHSLCQHCAKIDNDSECIGSAVGYSFSGHQNEQTGSNFITCDNTPGTCRHSLCQCDYALAVGIAERANEWREENDHLVGNFEMKQQCVGFNSRDWLHDEKHDFTEDGLRFDQKNILDFEDSGFLETAATTFAPTTDSSKAAAPLPNGIPCKSRNYNPQKPFRRPDLAFFKLIYPTCESDRGLSLHFYFIDSSSKLDVNQFI
ncbi:unnamed protein product [Oikopleura dioica]|uniref:Phospholipase A2-like central domain-containing protein n=1 Tax=Oikopleura dioica TaxID=34765 RepID=E4X9Z5_OIKDI|nr:unnamed protein product [Oikopleura dioica]